MRAEWKKYANEVNVGIYDIEPVRQSRTFLAAAETLENMELNVRNSIDKSDKSIQPTRKARD